MEQIICNSMSVGYGDTIVARNISFTLNRGDYICVIGANGTGKTTLIRTILGLIPKVSGEMMLGEGIRSTEIGYLSQKHLEKPDFPASVIEVVLSGFINKMGLRPFYTQKEKKEAIENLEKMGIAHLQKCCFRELSGGQKQRVLFARALCATQKILILDEPVASLDPHVTKEMYEIISMIHEEGISIIMISHDVTQATHYATHVLNMNGTVQFMDKKVYEETKEGGLSWAQ